VVTVKFRRPHTVPADNCILLSNRSGGAFNGFNIYTTADGYPSWYCRSGAATAGDSAMSMTGTRAWSVYTVLFDRTGGNGYSYVNLYNGGSSAIPAGSYTGNGLAIGATVTADDFCTTAGEAIEWIAVWYGAGIFAAWSADSYRLVKRLNMEAMGLRETVTNSKYWAFSGVSGSGASYKDHNGRWAFAYGDSHGTICAGNPNGLVLNPGSAYVSPGTAYNFDPTGTAGWTLTGGAMTRVDDTAALAAAKAEVWGPYVYQFANATGAPQVAYCGSDSVATTYEIFCIARYTAGAGATIGVRETATGNYTAWANISDGYVLTRSSFASLAAGFKLAIQIPDGCTIRFIGHGLQGTAGSGLVAYPAPVRTADWAAGGTVETHTVTEHTPVNASGSILINIAPIGWSTTGGKADARIFRTVLNATAIMYAEDTAPGGWSMTDGTTPLSMDPAYGPTDGVYQLLWMAWNTTTGMQYLRDTAVPASLVTAAYDGAMPVSGALEPYASDTGSAFAVKYIEIRQL
jgi:hypothetical protein